MFTSITDSSDYLLNWVTDYWNYSMQHKCIEYYSQHMKLGKIDHNQFGNSCICKGNFLIPQQPKRKNLLYIIRRNDKNVSLIFIL